MKTDLTNHFVSIADHDASWIEQVLEKAFELREQRQDGRGHQMVLAGRTLVMIFEKPSLRTWVSFEQAMLELGGQAIGMPGGSVGIGKREIAGDVARVLAGMVNGICARVFEHQRLVELALHSSIPVINALSDESHPCQALADIMTVMDEFGRDLRGKTIAFVGDGNNVARSLATICGKLGLNFNLAAPSGYELEQQFVDRIMAQVPQMNFEICHDPRQAVDGADVICTDTWVSMGQEQQSKQRWQVFGEYQVNDDLLNAAPPHAIVLHCLPAHRGLEITDQVMDGPRSRIFAEAHNRLHAQKGLLAVLMG